MGQIQIWTKDTHPIQIWVDDKTGLPSIKQTIITEAEYRENMFDIYEARIEKLEKTLKQIVGDLYETEKEVSKTKNN